MTPDDMRKIKLRPWLKRISSEVSKETGLTLSEIMSYRKFPEHVRARREVIRRASSEGLTGREIARAMDIDQASVRAALR